MKNPFSTNNKICCVQSEPQQGQGRRRPTTVSTMRYLNSEAAVTHLHLDALPISNAMSQLSRAPRSAFIRHRQMCIHTHAHAGTCRHAHTLEVEGTGGLGLEDGDSKALSQQAYSMLTAVPCIPPPCITSSITYAHTHARTHTIAGTKSH